MTQRSVALILNYAISNGYALNVLAGALETSRLLDEVPVRFVRGADEVIEALDSVVGSVDVVVVAWSFYSPFFLKAVEDLNIVRSTVPDSSILHVAGGVHASAQPERTLRAGFDYVGVGEGETTFVRFMEALITGAELSGVPGLASLDGDDAFSKTGPVELLELDAYPAFSERHLKFNPIEITRGCIYGCKFCQTPFMFKARFRHRTVKNICRHVAIMRDRGLTDVRFITPTSLSYGTQDEVPNLAAIEELLAAVRHTVGDGGRVFFGSFPSEVRPEHVSEEALAMLRKYISNDNIIIGGQSGSERVLDSTNRGHGVSVIEDAVRIAVDSGFLPNVDFIFGLPGETAEEAITSLDFAEHLADLGARIHGHTFMPLPGTPFSDEAPGRIAQETRRRLKRMTDRRKLYGKWEPQEEIAAELATIVRRPRRKRPEGSSDDG